MLHYELRKIIAKMNTVKPGKKAIARKNV